MSAGTEREVSTGLRATREARGFDQPELAARIGVTKQTISNWELGTATPGKPARRLLAWELGVSVDDVNAWFDSTTDEAAQPAAAEAR